MLIRLSGFQGVAPSIDPTMLPDGMAQSAIDCKLGSGAIKTVKQAQNQNVTGLKTGTKTTIWLYDDNGTPYWFHWVDQDVNAVKSPLPDDAYKRVYWTGEGPPKYAPLNYAVTGGSDYPVNSHVLGLPSPAAPVASAAAGSDPTLDETRAYLVRFVTEYGEVGPPSAASNLVTVGPGNVVTVDLPTSPPVGAYNVATLDIFRTNTGTVGTEYQYVASVAIGQSSYSDTKESAELGFILDSADYLAPNAGMTGLVALPFGSLAGFYNNVLCFSAVYQPHAWPASAQYAMADTIISIAVFGNSVLVTTTGAPYIVTGASPAAMTVERFEEGYACVSKRATVDMGYSVIYPSPIGLMQVGVGGAKMLTEGVCTIDEWKALLGADPSEVHAYAYGGKYFAFTGTGVYAFNPANGTYVQLSSGNLTGTVTAGYSEGYTGKLYLMAGNNVVLFDGGAAASAFSWKSKKFTAPAPVNLAVLQVFANTATTVKIYADGVLKSTSTVASSAPVRLPGGFLSTSFEFEISSIDTVSRVLAATSMAELAQI